MKAKPTKEHANTIGRVMRRSASRLVKDGYLSAFCELDCRDGRLVIDAEIGDLESKDRLANIIRVMTILHRAHRVAFVAETWRSSEGWSGRPSEDPNRSEAVMVLVEDAQGHSMTMLDIKRTGAGHITGLGSPETTYQDGPNTLEGRFAGLLRPAELHDDEDARRAGEELLRRWMRPARPGMLPGLGSSMTGRV